MIFSYYKSLQWSPILNIIILIKTNKFEYTVNFKLRYEILVILAKKIDYEMLLI